MNLYDWILFDADDTLFHFDAYLGLQRLFASFKVNFTSEDYLTYQNNNLFLWSQYQQNIICAEQVKERRFQKWADRLQMKPCELNSAFLEQMVEICSPLEGSIELLDALRGQFKLGIITNGFTQIQERRLARMGLREHFDLLVISEEVGYAKPQAGIFEYALAKMGKPPRHSVLMVGDNPETDILGGINAGFDTCWLNRLNKTAPNQINPSYEIRALMELRDIIYLE